MKLMQTILNSLRQRVRVFFLRHKYIQLVNQLHTPDGHIDYLVLVQLNLLRRELFPPPIVVEDRRVA